MYHSSGAVSVLRPTRNTVLERTIDSLCSFVMRELRVITVYFVLGDSCGASGLLLCLCFGYNIGN